jgi:hypothetical protein
MAIEQIDYASGVRVRRSRLAFIALVLIAIAAAGLAIAFIDGTTNTDFIGVGSLPVAAVATLLAIVAIVRKTSRGTLSFVSVGIAVTYWAALAAMVVPKLLASRR